jgi:hypothetical protein
MLDNNIDFISKIFKKAIIHSYNILYLYKKDDNIEEIFLKIKKLKTVNYRI